VTLTDMPEISAAVLLLPFLVAAVTTDLLSRSVPNILVVSMLGLGIAVHAVPLTMAPLLWSLGGVLVGFLLLLPFYALGGMGAGDVKLLAAAGSFLGPLGAMLAGICALGAGGVLALGVLAWRALAPPWSHERRGPDLCSNGLPYSLAISAGALTAVLA
jgi:prepilin peptidase CpaA